MNQFIGVETKFAEEEAKEKIKKEVKKIREAQRDKLIKQYPLDKSECFLPIGDAVERLCEELRKDKDYYYTWQANIAMAFQDACQFNTMDKQGYTPMCVMSHRDLHEVANEAAKNFLNQLIQIK